MERQFWLEIREIHQDNTLGKVWTVIPLQLRNFLKKHQGRVWYQDEIYLVEHRMVGAFQFETTGINKLKYPNVIYEKHWKA